MIANLIALGSIFSVLAFTHFFVDWIFQRHDAAMAKSSVASIRASHCLIYCLGFTPVLVLSGMSPVRILICLNILFWSHFIEDTYIPVFLWAKYIRQPPGMEPGREFRVQEGGWIQRRSGTELRQAFADWVRTPLGLILAIAIDQIIHLTFLWPVAVLMVWP